MNYAETIKTANDIQALMGNTAQAAEVVQRGLNTITIRVRKLSKHQSFEVEARKYSEGYSIRGYVAVAKGDSVERITVAEKTASADTLASHYNDIANMRPQI